MGRLLAGIGVVLVVGLASTWLTGSDRCERPLPAVPAEAAEEPVEAIADPVLDRKPTLAIPREEPEDLESYEIAVDVMTYLHGEKSPLAGIEVALGAGRRGRPAALDRRARPRAWGE